jgi:hypothetical protein
MRIALIVFATANILNATISKAPDVLYVSVTHRAPAINVRYVVVFRLPDPADPMEQSNQGQAEDALP